MLIYLIALLTSQIYSVADQCPLYIRPMKQTSSIFFFPNTRNIFVWSGEIICHWDRSNWFFVGCINHHLVCVIDILNKIYFKFVL
jgi:hypothetical protein